MSKLERTPDDAEVVIVGGGLNGPLLALALAQGGVPSIVIDGGERSRSENPGFDGRAYSLNAGTRRMLQALSLWAELERWTQPVLEIKISQGRPGEGAGPFWSHFEHAELEDGPLAHLLEDRYLRKVLLEAVERSPHVEMLWGEAVVEQIAGMDRCEVRLASGRRIRGRMLVGCDGRGSGTARRAGIHRIGWDYGQEAIVAGVAHELPHHGTAHQFFMPGGPLAILPLPGRRCSIVWTERTEQARALAQLQDGELLALLRPRFGDFLGEIRWEGPRYRYPLSLGVAERLVCDRVALVGDAAHGIHPLAGQGLNLGFRDAAVLAEVLVDARRRGADVGAPDVLGRYERWRRFDSVLLALATDGLNRLFATDDPVSSLCRGIGMALIGRTPMLRRGLAREAMGVSGELPRLQRGIPV